jgi:hypothetical protein
MTPDHLIALGLASMVALALVLCVVRAVADLITDWRIAELDDPDAHRNITRGVELHG